MIQNKIKEVQNFILFHYLHGSKYDTKFWEESKKYKIEDNNFYKIMNDSISKKDSINIDYGSENRTKTYGVHHPFSFKNMHDGLL